MLRAGLRHLSQEASGYNPQPLYKQQYVYLYTGWGMEQFRVTCAHEKQTSKGRQASSPGWADFYSRERWMEWKIKLYYCI